MESPSRALGSVASRYRQPAVGRPGSPSHRNGVWRYLWMPERDRRTAVAKGPTARSERLARLEAVLFLAREPLGSRKLADLASLADGTETRTLVRKLNRIYDLEGCAFRVMEVAGGFQLMSRPKFVPWLRRLCVAPLEVRLSPPVLETLAVVAYRQPVLRADVEAVRGVQCGEILRQLMERGLVRIAGRSEELGRPFLYGTTKQFLQVFGLRHLDELPRPQSGRPARLEEPDQGPADPIHRSADQETSNQPIHSNKTEGGSNVTSAADTTIVPEETLEHDAATIILAERNRISNSDADDDFEDEDDEDYEDYDDEEDDEEEEDEEEDEDEDEEEEEEEDDGLVDPKWEGVEDEDEEEEEEEEDDEEEDEEDEDWDDDDWDDEDDDDWEEDEDEEDLD